MAKKSDPLQHLMRRRTADAETGQEPASDFDTLVDDYKKLQQLVEEQSRLISTLQRESGADPLTGLANHKTLSMELERSLATARRYGRRHALILLNVADFSNLAAQLGEDTTTALLRHLSSLIRQNIRPTDVAAHPRFGEFGIILNELRAIENATMRAEEICSIASQTPCTVAGRSVHVFVNYGLCVFTQDDEASDIMSRARQSLNQSTTPSGTILS